MEGVAAAGEKPERMPKGMPLAASSRLRRVSSLSLVFVSSVAPIADDRDSSSGDSLCQSNKKCMGNGRIQSEVTSKGLTKDGWGESLGEARSEVLELADVFP